MKALKPVIPAPDSMIVAKIQAKKSVVSSTKVAMRSGAAVRTIINPRLF